jgi:hypothetical protein
MPEPLWPRRARLLVHIFQLLMGVELFMVGPYMAFQGGVLGMHPDLLAASRITAFLMLGGLVGSFLMLRHPPRSQRPIILGVLLIPVALTTLSLAWTTFMAGAESISPFDMGLFVGNLGALLSLVLLVRELRGVLFGE